MTRSPCSHSIDDSLNNIEFRLQELDGDLLVRSPSRRRQFIDTEKTCKALKDLMQRTKTLHNKYSPFMTLPQELQQQIFLLVQERGQDEIIPSHFRNHSWRKILLVCKAWHCMALGFPQLWTTLSVRKSFTSLFHERDPYLALWLRRSGRCKLQLEIDGDSGSMRMSEYVDEVATVLDRVEYLWLGGVIDRGLCDALKAASCPNLRSLVITAAFAHIQGGGLHFVDFVNEDAQSQARVPGRPKEARILPTLFGNNYDELRSLSLHKLLLYSGNTFGKLTQLHLRSQKYFVDASVTALVNLLSANPALEDLMFDQVFVGDVQVPKFKASLPRLKRLVFLAVTFAGTRFILSCLESAHEELALTCNNRGEPEPEIESLLEQCFWSFPVFETLLDVNMTLTNDEHRLSALNETAGLHLRHLKEPIDAEMTGFEVPYEPDPPFCFGEVMWGLSRLVKTAERVWLRVEGETELLCHPHFDAPVRNDQRLLAFRRVLRRAPALKTLIMEFECCDTYSNVLAALDILYEKDPKDVKIPSLWVVGRHALNDMLLYKRRRYPFKRLKFDFGLSIFGKLDEEKAYPEWLASMEKHELATVITDANYPYIELPSVCTEDTPHAWGWPKYGGCCEWGDNVYSS
ncbi:hypothetical protein NM688_g4714 [Phlebia brevispora]|uniref:Uncharacterized protein n=1 Tax=Phlebia brevispora TaxID=194682 RepID=A0ACC1T2C3_9APHY|nr:hypothetical protein NM688_g4714 [Phlebia brevispora]